MKKNIIVLTVITMIIILLSGCSNSGNSGNSTNISQNNVASSDEIASGSASEYTYESNSEDETDQTLEDVYSNYHTALYYSASTTSTEKENNYVAISELNDDKWPEMIMTADYSLSKKGYFKGNAGLKIVTYEKLENTDENIKVLYLDCNFLDKTDKVKGYSVLLKNDNNIVVYRECEDFNEYRSLEMSNNVYSVKKDIVVSDDAYEIDGENVSNDVATEEIDKLLDDLNCVLINDGEVDTEVNSVMSSLENKRMRPHDALVLCQAESAKYSSDEIPANEVWSSISGEYTTNSGYDTDEISIKVDSNGNFTGECLGQPQECSKEVDGQKISKIVEKTVFSGSFSNARKLDSMQYYVECDDFKVDSSKDYEISGDIMYKYVDSQQKLDYFNQFVIYKAGSVIADIPEEIEWWYQLNSFNKGIDEPSKTDEPIIEDIYNSDVLMVRTQE